MFMNSLNKITLVLSCIALFSLRAEENFSKFGIICSQNTSGLSLGSDFFHTIMLGGNCPFGINDKLHLLVDPIMKLRYSGEELDEKIKECLAKQPLFEENYEEYKGPVELARKVSKAFSIDPSNEVIMLSDTGWKKLHYGAGSDQYDPRPSSKIDILVNLEGVPFSKALAREAIEKMGALLKVKNNDLRTKKTQALEKELKEKYKKQTV
jgi:hypothetical protein